MGLLVEFSMVVLFCGKIIHVVQILLLYMVNLVELNFILIYHC